MEKELHRASDLDIGGIKNRFHIGLSLSCLPRLHRNLLPCVIHSALSIHATTSGSMEIQALLFKVWLEQIPCTLEEVLSVVIIWRTSEKLNIKWTSRSFFELKLLNNSTVLPAPTCSSWKVALVVHCLAVHNLAVICNNLSACFMSLSTAGLTAVPSLDATTTIFARCSPCSQYQHSACAGLSSVKERITL